MFIVDKAESKAAGIASQSGSYTLGVLPSAAPSVILEKNLFLFLGRRKRNQFEVV
jgi:hypothetical protein